jgi:tRNA 5-methylaminomethyl-2-thiouridine biosynthesis bifunctional protein
VPRPPNHLLFKDPKTPYSERFDDLYFSNEVGVDESIYIYLEGTGALRAIRNQTPNIRIGEVGFGVGLNFLLTLRAFLTEGHSTQQLHYTSAELFPIEREDLLTLYSAYPDLLPYAEMILDQYPLLTPGVHRLIFADGRAVLDLMIGDAAQLFSRADFTVDFWYWDGFSPSKNPDAFSDALFEAVHQRSSSSACGTSFTAATWVRLSLEAHGFQVSKRTGFGKKRECITGVIAAEAKREKPLAWFSRENFSICKLPSTQKSIETSIAVIGAGLGGSAIARNLADRGFKVTVYDGEGIANRASSNSVALFNIQLSKQPNPISRFSQAAIASFLQELKRLSISHRLGIERTDPDAADCLETSSYPETFFALREGGVYFPECGMINPRTLCEKRLDHPNITLVCENVIHVVRNPIAPKTEVKPADELIGNQALQSSQRSFKIIGKNQLELGRASQVIYALGADPALSVSPLEHLEILNLPLRAVRGQTLLVLPTSESRSLTHSKIENGYVSPIAPEVTGHEFHLLGATYQAREILPNQEEIDREKLLFEAREKWSEFSILTADSVQASKVGFRASTPDKLPLIGPLSDAEWCHLNYNHALKGSVNSHLPTLQVKPGEWVLSGLGSRGVTFSSIAAETLASMMLGLPLPLENDLLEHVHPIRFTIRDLKKSRS